jgi:hypothetical protein
MNRIFVFSACWLLCVLTIPSPTLAQSLIHAWSSRFGDSDTQFGKAVAADALGNVFATGEFWGTVDFGGGPLTSAGGWDVVVAKLDAAGNHLWSKRFGDGGFQFSEGVAVDGFDNVIITGTFSNSVNFGGGPLTVGGKGILGAAMCRIDAIHTQTRGRQNSAWQTRFPSMVPTTIVSRDSSPFPDGRAWPARAPLGKLVALREFTGIVSNDGPLPHARARRHGLFGGIHHAFTN